MGYIRAIQSHSDYRSNFITNLVLISYFFNVLHVANEGFTVLFQKVMQRWVGSLANSELGKVRNANLPKSKILGHFTVL